MMNHPLHYVKFLLNKELNALYVSIVFRALAFSMVGIFVPLYLYKELNYGFNYVIYFYLVYSVFFGIVSFPSAFIVNKFSFKYISLFCSPFYILYFVLLYFLEFNPWIFFWIPILQGTVDALFWLAFHCEFSGVSDYKFRGKEIGNWYNFSLLSGFVGPLLGGGILLFSGFKLLFFFVGVLLFGSTVPLFFSYHRNKHFKIRFKEVFKRKYLKDGIAFFGQGGVLIVSAVFWPIFVYSIVKGYLKLGSLATMIGLVSILFTIFIGKLSDRYNRRKVLRIGALFHSAAWFMKFFITNLVQLIGLYVFRAFASIAADLPFTALTYDKAKNRIEYFILREMYMSLGRMFILILILISGKLAYGFIFAGIFSLFHLFL